MSQVDTHLSRLETAGLIALAQLQPDLEYLFRHVLVQNAAYDSLLRQDRRRLHQRVGETLEATYQSRLDEMAAIIAHHFIEAGDDQRALPHLERAGDHALSMVAFPEADRFFHTALDHAGSEDDATRLLLKIGETQYARLMHDQALATWKTCIDRSLQAGNTDRAARAFGRRIRVLWWLLDAHESLAEAQQAYRLLSEAPQSN